MSEIKKPNDWLVSIVSNPDYGLANFSEAGLNESNTQLKSRDYYKNTDFVQNSFKDSDGKFDEVLFNKTYDTALNTFDAFRSDAYDKSVLDRIETSFSNSFRKMDQKTSDPKLTIEKSNNVLRTQEGIHGFGIKTPGAFSIAELAQRQKVVDYETGVEMDWTPNDYTGWKAISRSLSTPLVLATYEEDTDEKDMYGRTVKKKKGDLKTNADGNFYYETLGNRDASGKSFLSALDTLTEDGSSMNKYDIFDADGKEQAIGSAIARTALKWSPIVAAGLATGGSSLFAQGVVAANNVYMAAGAMHSLTQALPELYKGIEGVILGDSDIKDKSAMWKAMNTLQSRTGAISQGVSDYSKQKTFTWENVINMTSDVMLQLGQQQMIAKIPGKLGMQNHFVKKAITEGKHPYEGIKKFNDFSSGLATYYMTVTSGTQAYSQAKEAGHSERTSGLIMLGTLIGLHKIMKSDIGQWPIKQMGLDDARAALQPITRNLAKVTAEGHMISETATEAVKSKFVLDVANKVASNFKNILNSPKSFLGAMANESIEEVSEEMVQDAMMILGKAGEALGVTKKTNYDWFESQWYERYAMSAFGGAIGGGMHHVNWNAFRGIVNTSDEDVKDNLVHAIYKYGKDEVVSQIERDFKNGAFGLDTTLGVDLEIDTDGKRHFLNASDVANSQAMVVKNQMIGTVNIISQILEQTGSQNLSMDQRRAFNPNGDSDLQRLLDLGLESVIRDELLGINTNIVNIIAKHKESAESEMDPLNKEVLEKLKLEKQHILTGGRFDDYFQYGLLHLNPQLAQFFKAIDKDQLSVKLYQKPYEALSESQKSIINIKFESAKNRESADMLQAVDIMNAANKVIDSSISKYDKEYQPIRNQLVESLRSEISQQLAVLGAFDTETGEPDPEILQRAHGRKVTGVPNFNGDPTKFVEFKDKILNILNEFNNKGIAIDGQLAENVNNYIKAIDNTISKEIGKQVDVLPEDAFIFNIANDVEPVKEFIEKRDLSLFSEYLKKIDSLTYDDLESVINGAIDFEVISDDLSEDEQLEIVKEEAKRHFTDLVSRLTLNVGSLIEGSQQLKDAVKKTATNPIYDYLDKVATFTDSEAKPIFEILRNEDLKKDQKELAEYILANSTQDQLKRSLEDISIAIELVKARAIGQDRKSYAESLNGYRKSGKSKLPLLTEITQESAFVMSGDLNILKAQIEFFIKLSSYNQADVLREHKKIAIKMMNQFSQLFEDGGMIDQIKENLGDSILDGFEALKGANINGLTALTTTIPQVLEHSGTITPELLKEAEQFLTSAEDLVYTNFEKISQSRSESKQDLVIKLFGDTFKTQQDAKQAWATTSILNSDTQESLTDYDKLSYVTSILAMKSSVFKTYLKEFLQEQGEDSSYAPIYAQEYPARLAVAMGLNPEVMNAIGVITHTEGISLQNLIYINSGPGTGKTTAISETCASILKKMGKTITGSSMLAEQTQVLADSIKEEKGLTKDELIMKILKNKPVSEFMNNENQENAEVKTSEISKLGDNAEIGQVIFIDEVTHVTHSEISVIQEWAKLTGRVLITTGDNQQEGATHNLRFCNVIKTPTLNYSMRAGAMTTRDNTAMTQMIAGEIGKFYNGALDENGVVMTTSTANEKKKTAMGQLLPKAFFKYFESADGFMTGLKTYEEGDFTKDNLIKHIKSIKAQGKNVMIIYDNDKQSDYQMLTDLSDLYGLKMVQSNKMQGLEADYVILSSNLGYTVGNESEYAKKINTLFSRAKIGTIANKKGFPFKVESTPYNDMQSIPSEILKKFREDRLNALDGYNEKLEGVSTKQPGPPSTINVNKNEESIQNSLFGVEEDDDEFFNNDDVVIDPANRDNDGVIISYSQYRPLGIISKKSSSGTEISVDVDLYEEGLDYDLQRFVTSHNNGIVQGTLGDIKIDNDLHSQYISFVDEVVTLHLEGVSISQIIKTIQTDNRFSNFNLNEYDWDNANLVLDFKNASEIDRNYEVGGKGDDSYLSKGKITKRIAISVPKISSPGEAESNWVMTYAALGSKDTDNAYKAVETQARAALNKGATNVQYVLDPSLLTPTGSETRIQKVNGAKYGLHNFKKDPRWAKTTKVQIMTGKIPLGVDPSVLANTDEKTKKKIRSMLYDKSLNGKPFIFVSRSRDTQNWTDEQMSTYFFNQRAERLSNIEKMKLGQPVGTRIYPPLVTMVKLESKPLHTEQFFETFRKNIDAFKNKKDSKILRASANKFLGLNMMKGVYEYKLYLEAQSTRTAEQEKHLQSLKAMLFKIRSEFKLEPVTVDVEGKPQTEVVIVEGTLNPKPLSFIESELEEQIKIKDGSLKTRLFNNYYSGFPNHNPDFSFQDLLLFFADYTNKASSDVKVAIFADGNMTALKAALETTLPGRDGQLKPRFPNGVMSNPIYEGKTNNTSGAMNWMEACYNPDSQFGISGVIIESQRYLLQLSGFVAKTVTENAKENQKKEVALNKFKADLKQQVDQLGFLSGEYNSFLRDLIGKETSEAAIIDAINSLNPTMLQINANNDGVVGISYENNKITPILLSSVDGGSFPITSVTSDEILGEDADNEYRYSRSTKEVTTTPKNMLNAQQQLDNDIYAFVQSLTEDQQQLRDFFSDDSGSLDSFKNAKYIFDKYKGNTELMNLIDRKNQLECP